MKSSPTVSLTLALVVAVAPLGAQIPARVDTARLEPVVTTTTRTPLPLSAAPSTIVLIGRELRDRGIDRVQDALREVPGIAIAPSGGWGAQTSAFLRGGNSGYTKVLVDGIPVNQPGGAIDWSNLSTDHVERIEVVRGPASVLYGSDAVSGVVQIFTRRARSDGRHALGVGLRGGSNATREADLSWSAGGPSRGLSFGAAHRATEGIYAFNNRYRSSTLSALARIARAGRGDLALSARAARSNAHIPTGSDGELTDSNAYRTERRLVVALDGGYYVTPRVELRMLAGTSEERALSDDQPDSPGDTNGFYAHDEARIARRTADLRANVALGLAGIFTGGVAAEGQRVRARGYSNFGPAEPFDESRTNVAYYAQVLGTLGDRVTASASLRVDDNQKYGTFTTYRGSLVGHVAGGLRAHAAAGTAFKEPLMLEVFSTAFTRGNPDLNPERSASAEVGLAHDLGGMARVSATAFVQQFRDLVQYDGGAVPPHPNYFNVGAARADGIELELQTLGAGSWRGSAGYTWLRTEVTDSGFGGSSGFEQGKPLVRRPEHSGFLRVGFAPLARLQLDAIARWVGARDDLDFRGFPTTRVRMPDYATVDLSGRMSMVRGTALTWRVTNLLDRAHQPVFNYPGAGRAVLVGVRLGDGA